MRRICRYFFLEITPIYPVAQVNMQLDQYYDTLFSRYHQRPAIQSKNRVITYEELDHMSAQLAGVYRSLGLEEAHRVGILMHNRPEYIITQIAAARAGVVAVPLNDQLDRSELQDILSEISLSALFLGPDFIDIAKSLDKELLEIKYVIGVTEEDQDLPVGFHDFQKTVERGNKTPPKVDIVPSDSAAIFHSGGTTGSPKQIIHTHHGLTLNALAHIQELEIQREERVLLTTPLAHTSNFIVRGALAQGATIFLQDEFSPQSAVNTIQSENITWTFLVPTMIARLLHSSSFSESALNSLNTLVYGASSMPPALLREGINKLGQVFIQLYGLMEAPNLVTTLPKSQHNPSRPSRLQTVGYPTQFAEITLIDEENQWPDGIGEVAVESPFGMKGYVNAESNSDQIRTGDLGRFDEAGRLVVLDRIQDLIQTPDGIVFSPQVENALQQHPKIRQAAAIAVPADGLASTRSNRRQHVEQQVKGIVATTDNGQIDLDDVQKFCRQSLDGHEIPQSVDFVERLPETPFGKVDKATLREPYW